MPAFHILTGPPGSSKTHVLEQMSPLSGPWPSLRGVKSPLSEAAAGGSPATRTRHDPAP
jgi:hypothetical protein